MLPVCCCVPAAPRRLGAAPAGPRTGLSSSLPLRSLASLPSVSQLVLLAEGEARRALPGVPRADSGVRFSTASLACGCGGCSF